jgi:fermentation-respiration switch protein FrsA (DUF1100 family)
MRDQLRANPANAPVLDDALAAIDSLEAGQRIEVSNMHPSLQALFAPKVQPFLIDLMAQDPVKLARSTDLPMLIVQGGRDIQVSDADFDAFRSAGVGAEFLLIETMNHVLKTVETEDRAANLATYADPSIPVSDELTDGIARFVQAQGR